MQLRNTTLGMECQEVISETWNWGKEKLFVKQQCTNIKLHRVCFNKLREIQNLYFSVNSVITLIYYPILNMAKAWQKMPTKMNPVWIKLFILPDN